MACFPDVLAGHRSRLALCRGCFGVRFAATVQVLHAGRYAYHPWAVAPSAEKAPINQYTPEALSNMDVHYTVRDFVR